MSQWGLGESSWTFSEFLKGVLGTLGEYLLEIGGSLEALEGSLGTRGGYLGSLCRFLGAVRGPLRIWGPLQVPGLP